MSPVTVPFGGLFHQTVDAPASGFVLSVDVDDGAAGSVAIYPNPSYVAALQEYFANENLAEPLLVTPTVRPFADQWYLSLNPVDANAPGASGYDLADFSGPTGPLNGRTGMLPGDTGWTAWVAPAEYLVAEYGGIDKGWIGEIGATAPATLNVTVPMASTVVVGGLMMSGGTNVSPYPYLSPWDDCRWILSATGDIADSTLAVKIASNGEDTVSATLQYTDSVGGVTTLGEYSGPFPLSESGNEMRVALIVRVQRLAMNLVNIQVDLGTYIDASTMTISGDGVVASLVAENVTIENVDHNIMGFFSAESDPTHWAPSVLLMAAQWGESEPVAGTFTVLPQYWVTPP